MIPGRKTLDLFESNPDREAAIEESRRARQGSAYPPRPHKAFELVPCAECVAWARSIVASRPPAGDGQ